VDKQGIRALYKSASLLQTHLAYSTAIATAAVCKYRFRLRYVLGANIPTDENTPIGLAAHEVLSLGMLGPIFDLWGYYYKDTTLLSRRLFESIIPIKDRVLNNYKLWYQSRDIPFPSDFEENLNGVLLDLLTNFAKEIMVKLPRPRRVLTEVTITNVKKQHEGRLDALLEFNNGSYLVIDWKTSPEPAHSYKYNHLQALSNALLANYRYHNDENNFAGCKVAIVHCDGVLKPLIPPTYKLLDKIKEARNYVLECLSGRAPLAEMPYYIQCLFCPDQQNCDFYRRDTLLDREGFLPPSYSAIRRLLFRRKMVVLEERANIHVHKFVVDYVLSKMGEPGLKALEEAGIVESGYRLKNIEKTTLVLERNSTSHAFDKRDIVRIIGIEPDIPLLACINAKGSVQDVNGSCMKIRIYNETAAELAFKQLLNFPILVMRDNIDLTDRELRPLHFFQLLAAKRLGANSLIGHEPR